jgi:hypothetical protein
MLQGNEPRDLIREYYRLRCRAAAGHAHPAPNDIDPQGPGRSGRDAIAPGAGLDRAA